MQTRFSDEGSTEDAMPAQSYLFVPATRPDRFAGALASGADAVIVDLEDAVAPAAKVEAREALARWLSPSHPVLIRINGRGTAWFDGDAALGGLDGVAGIVVPKAESADDIALVASRADRRIPVYPLIETAKGMWNALAIAQAPQVRHLMFGTLDFIAEMGMDDDREPLNHYRARLALVSKVAGIGQPIDGVTPDVDDLTRLHDDARNGKDHGCGAKLCIHPKQIDTVHACYGPTESELAWSRSVIEASNNTNAGAIVVDGKMVDRPVVLRARRLLMLAARRSS
jgi:citrate lyase subunit beta/citryl-CoA lyase